MEKFIGKCKEIYNKDVPLKTEWIIAIAIAILMMIMFNYVDFKSFTIWSTNILDCIANGDITKYYEYTAQNIYGNFHQYDGTGDSYNLIIWSIWNIPIWLIQRFTGKAILMSPLLLMWSKLFIFVSLLVTLIFTFKICKLLFNDRKKALWIVYLAATFIFTYIGFFYAGQNDVLICMFGTIAIYYILNGNNKAFYVFSSLAITIDYFFLLPYIAIILLKEKKIWKIILKIIAVIYPIFILRCWISTFPMFYESTKQGAFDVILGGILHGDITALFGQKVSGVLLSLIVTYFIAYLVKPEKKEIENNYIVYFSVIPFILYLMFSSLTDYYRPVIFMPMLMILYGFKPELFRINVILDTIFSIVSLIIFPIGGGSLFAGYFSMNNSILTKIFGINQASMINMQEKLVNILGEKLETVKTIGTTIIFAVLAIMVIINYPKITVNRKEQENPQKPERWIIWIRTLAIVPVLIFLLINI